jgi:hypothetical protein
MDLVKWIRHKDKDILFVDLSNVQQTSIEIEAAQEAEKIIKTQPKDSVLTLIDYTGMHYDVTGVEAQKNYSSAVAPYVRASAAVGIDGLKKIILRSVARITSRNIKLFDDLESAKDWLATQ